MGVPISTAGICTQTELGLKSFRHMLYEHQLKYYLRILKLGNDRWVKQALNEHSSGLWSSPYLNYICDIRKMLGLFELPMKQNVLLSLIEKQFVKFTNKSLGPLSLPSVLPITKFCRKTYVQEGANSEMIANFRFNMVRIGRKYPRFGKVATNRYCPLCPQNVENTPEHVAFFCPEVENVRKEQTEISFFRNLCMRKGYSEYETYSMYLNGLDWNENPVELKDYLNRGAELDRVLSAWLSKW